MNQKQFGELLSMRARAISRWESGQSGPTKRNRERLVGAVSARDAAAGAALDAELTRLSPLPPKKHPAAAPSRPADALAPPPPDPAVLERGVMACADLMDVSPRRARVFMAEALRAFAAARCSVDDAIAWLLAAPTPPPVDPPSAVAPPQV